MDVNLVITCNFVQRQALQ